MRSWLGWALAGLGVLVVGALGFALYSSVEVLGGLSTPSSVAPAPAPAEPAPVAVFPTAPSPAPVPAPAPGVVPPPTEEQQAQLLAPAEAGSWEATPLGARPRALGRVGMELEEGLSGRLESLSTCFSRRVSAGFKGKAVSRVPHPDAEDTGNTILVLQVEAGQGELRIVDAPVEVAGGASDGTLACVQERLRNVKVQTDARAPGPRFRMRFTVSP